MRSLRARVALAALAAASIVVVVASAVLIVTAGRDERRDLDNQLEQRASALARPFGPPGAFEDRLVPEEGAAVRLVRDGRVAGELGDAPEDLPAPTRAGFETVEAGGNDWRSYSLSLPRFVGGAQLQVAESLKPLEDRVAKRRRLIVLVALAALAAAAGLGYFFGGVALRPLARLRATAAGVGTTKDLDARVPAGDGPEEVEALTESLNAMLARLQASSESTEAALDVSRRFAADAGHELRTPLTSMAANLDALARNPDMQPDERRRALEGARSELTRLAGVLDALQELARGDSGPHAVEMVDLAELADGAVESARSRHPGVTFEVDGDAIPMLGSAAGLRLILDNLLQNAAVHGATRAEVALEQLGGAGPRVVVDDDGPGIPEAERGKVLGRFARGSRPGGQGSGLGLAIVAQQTARHGGQVQIGDSPLGGTRVTVNLA